jgi:ABC-type multidrug transport system fused ATPase/permease subunit
MDNNVSREEDWKTLKRLFLLVKPYKNWVIISAICAIAIGACDVISVALITKLINTMLDSSSAKILSIILLAVATVLVGIIASYLMPYFSGCVGSYVIRDLRNKIALHFDNVQVSIKDKMHTGDTASRLNNDISMVEIFIGNLSDYIYTPLIVIVTFIYLLTIQWKLVILSFLSVPIALALSNKLSKPMGKYNEEYYKYLGETNSLMQDAIVGISVLKAFNLQDVFYAKCNEMLNKSLEIYDNKINVRGTLLMPIMFMVYEFPYVVCAAYGGYLAVYENLSTSGLVAFILLLRFLVGPASQLPNLVMDARSATGASRRLVELLELQTERSDGSIFENGKEEYDIEFDNVVFGYKENEEILKHINFKIKRGSSVALVGPSGCGKSTVMNLICGFHKAGKGSIKLYGKDIEDWNLTSLRQQLALVSQDTYLFPGSIEENIRFGKQNSTREEVIAAAKKANSHTFIMNLSSGYDTEVGERGVKLSGGQKQRISIARAILKGAPILLLDEPTSALDTKSELLVQQSIKQLAQKKTVLIIAHRLSTIKQVDLILVLDNGTIVESGTHDELLNKGGLYNKLYIKQFIDQDNKLSVHSKEGA